MSAVEDLVHKLACCPSDVVARFQMAAQETKGEQRHVLDALGVPVESDLDLFFARLKQAEPTTSHLTRIFRTREAVATAALVIECQR